MPKRKSKTAPILIESVRLSFIWAEVLPAFLQQDLRADSPFAFLTQNYSFPDVFVAARNGLLTKPKFEAPWIRERKQHFWMRYLVQGELNDVTGTQAWSYLVPLRFDTGIRVDAGNFKGAMFIDAFYYPFGLALAISFRWEPALSLNKLVPKAYAACKNGKFRVAGSTQPLSLDQMAATVLTSMRKSALGDEALAGYVTQDPFSIFTVIQAQGANPDFDVQKDRSILQALEALTSWPADYTHMGPPDPARFLPTKGNPPKGTALYAGTRGRAVWIPGLFGISVKSNTQKAISETLRTSKLGCYHRNLLFASLQVESLGQLISYTAKLFEQGKKKVDLPSHHRQVAGNGAEQLAKLYLGLKDDTWRSASAQRQILDNCYARLQRVLAEFGKPPLPQSTVRATP